MVPGHSPEQDAFERYLTNKKILIADPSPAARSGMARVFSESGVKGGQLVVATTYKQAHDQIEALKPQIVIAEYELGKRCGLDLLQSQRQSQPEAAKESLFIV